MKVKTGWLIVAERKLAELDRAEVEPGGVAAAFRLALLVRQIVPVLREAKEKRKQLLESLAVQDEDNPGTWLFVNEDGEVDPERARRFAEAELELMETEVDLDFEPLTLEELSKFNVKLSPSDLRTIFWVLRDGELLSSASEQKPEEKPEKEGDSGEPIEGG